MFGEYNHMEYQDEVKVVILGDSGAGKSLTLERLMNDDDDVVKTYSGEATPGIRIRHKPDLFDDRKILVHFWDFGGQEHYQPFHRLFMTKDTIYVLMLNANDSFLDIRARHWLNTINSAAPGAPVLLVVNHIDINPTPAISWQALAKAYNNTRDVIWLSASKNDQEKFREALVEKLKKLILQLCVRGSGLTEPEARVRDALSTMKESCIRGYEYVRICRECGVADGEMSLLGRLVRQGVVYTRDSVQNLYECVIFQNEWIASAIYALLDSQKADKFNGIVTHDRIGRILASEWRRTIPYRGYKLEYFETMYILGMLRETRLSFSVGDGMEFIPALCGHKPPELAVEYEADPGSLETLLSFEYLPTNMIHRLMLELKDSLELACVWYSGALFQQMDTGVSAVVRQRDNTIQICVRGTNDWHRPNGYLGQIRQMLIDDAKRLDLGRPESTVVYKMGHFRDYFHTEMLLGSLNNGASVVYSRNLRRMVPILDILEQTELSHRVWPEGELLPDTVQPDEERPAGEPFQTVQPTEEPSQTGQPTEEASPMGPPEWEYRVVFLGDGEAGKTLTIARLMDETLEPKTALSNKNTLDLEKILCNTTPGIKISDKKYMIGGKHVQVNYWDFGGQEILYSMHRMFLVKHTLYVVVLNTRQDNQDERARFWLRYLRTYAKEAPVLLVLNKVDQNDGASVNEAQLRRLNGNLKKTIRLSAWAYSKDEFEEALVKPLMEQIRMDEGGRNTFGTAEIQIRDQIRKEGAKQKRFSVSTFREICESKGLNSDQQNTLLHRFSNAGVFVYFGKAIWANTHMLLDPEWITNAIYRILEKRHDPAVNGILSHEVLKEALAGNGRAGYAIEDLSYVLGVMHEHHLSYEIPKRNTEFIPMLCTRQEPPDAAEIIQNPDAIELQIQFEYLPAGVLFQLIVDLQAELEQKNVWLNGAIFAQDGCRALVCREGDTLSIYVLGAERTRVIEYLNELRGRIRDVAGDLNHTATIRAQMLGFRIGNQMEYFDYDRLLAAKECKEERVISRILKASVVIQDVLDQTDRSSRWETRKLLKNIALACAQFQAKTLSISDGENDRNTELRDTLENMDYNVKDQTLIGEGKSGKRPNELDLLVRRADGEPWLILEALNVTTKDASTNWDEHLEKLVGRYNVWGLPTLVLLSYVNCSGSKFASLFEKYDAHMKEYRPKAAKLIPNSHESFCPFSEEKSAFRAAQCTYERNGKPVTVYHYFVHMGSKKSDSGK